MTPMIDFERNFDVVFPSRLDWQSGWPISLPAREMVKYTDGSKMEDGTGAGVFTPEPDSGTWFHLGKLPSVFQAETFAALAGAGELWTEETRGKEAYICSDSEAVMKALMSPVTTSKLVRECKDCLNRMGRRNRITLVWVPGHSGVDGNEKADELARTGSSASAYGPEPYIPIPQSLCAKALKDWVRTKHTERWMAYEGGVHTKCFLLGPAERWSRELLRMDRNRISRVVGAITGHCGLNRHLTRLNIRQDSDCSCGLDEETGRHVICDCPKFSQLRRRILGSYVMQPMEVFRLGPILLDRFLVGTRLFR